MKDLVRLIVWMVADLFRSRAALEAEILTLRQQINVPRRAAPKKQTFSSIDRLIFVCLYRLRPGVRDARKAASTWRRWHAPAHHDHLAHGACVAHDRSGIVGKDAGHRWQVADILVHHPEQGDDRGLVGRDRIKIAHAVVPARPWSALTCGPSPQSARSQHHRPDPSA